MELSDDLLTKVKELRRQSEESVRGEKFRLSKDYEVISCQDDVDIINIDNINFTDDETWLLESNKNLEVKDVNKWLYEGIGSRNDAYCINDSAISRKIIDTKTYTRPKRKFLRPSIEKYNEQYSDGPKLSEGLLTQEIQNYMASTAITSSIIDDTKPLHFDLSQPASCNIFDDIIMNSADIDSFTNMSPPSLVNSMCSATFTNLMENSFIKNDPVLSEIRNSDLSAEILRENSESRLYRSLTESCSSLSSDSAENFLKRTLPILNTTIKSDLTPESESSNSTMVSQEGIVDMGRLPNDLNTSYVVEQNLNNTFSKNIMKENSSDMSSSNNSDSQTEGVNLNTFRKFPSEKDELDILPNATFYKDSNESSVTDLYYNSALSGTRPLNNTYENIVHSENTCPNTTNSSSKGTYKKSNGTFQKPKNAMNLNNITGRLDRTASLENHLEKKTNDASYIISKNRNCSEELVDNSTDIKRNSDHFVTGSTDSLEDGSSPSSRGSNRVLNMAEVDAIVEYQERSLQIMSTPKPAKSTTKLFENTFISPIMRQKEHVSDSDLSTTDGYLTGRSSLSRASSAHSQLRSPERPVKSLSNLKQPTESNAKPHGTVTKSPSNFRAFQGSHNNLQRKIPESSTRGSYSNLGTVGSTLKRSYTNLKPVGLNLPVITSQPNNGHLNTTTTLLKGDEVFKNPAPLPSKHTRAPVNVIKPLARASGLPRPVSTGIPRAVSRIPAPRTTRPQTARGGSQPVSKVNLNQGY